jgi:hypothetical protein
MELKKTFIAGKMNKDLDERLVPDGEFIDALNITIDTAGGSNIGSVSNSLGNSKVSDIQAIVENEGITYIGSNPKTIGSVTFEANNLIYWMVVSDTFEAIFEYSEIFSSTSIVLMRTDGLLGFNKNYPITGINYIPETTGEGPFLYWTDGINPPRRINISRAKSYVTDDVRMLEDINVILRPPLYAPKINLSFDPAVSVSNNIQDKFLYFSYRFRYTDNQYSSLAPFSAVAFQANSFSYDYATGDNKGMLNKYNKVDITFDTGNEFVQEIQVLFFDTFSLNVSIIDNYNKVDLNIDDNFRSTIVFSANKIYTPLESSEVTRLFDNVPLTAKAQDIIGNRLLYGNYVQFRNIVNEDEVKIIPSYTLTLSPEAITTNPVKTFRSDRDYEIGIIYTDEYGRMTTALTSKTNTLYIPATNSDTANSIRLELINEAPFWATNYRFAIKQAQGDYYNIFPYTFVVDGVFRYFLINEADRDKITVGGYIIFKTSNGVATHSNKQFKILELEYKAVSTLFLREGLYFKVKADPSDLFLADPITQNIFDDGSGRGINNSGFYPLNAVQDRSSSVEFDYAYYANNGDNTLIYPYQNNSGNITANYNGPISNNDIDYRITIQILNPSNPSADFGTHFRWTYRLNGSNYSSAILISDFVDITVSPPYTDDFRLYFDTLSNYNVGDLHIVNVRGSVRDPLLPTRFSSTVYSKIVTIPETGLFPYNSTSISDYRGHAILLYNGPIYPGAVIDINILRDESPTSSNPDRAINNTWTSNNYYKNIEEWFWQSGAYASFQYIANDYTTKTSPINLIFRRAAVPPGKQSTPSPFVTQYIDEDTDVNSGSLCLLIRGVGDYNGSSPNEIKAELKINQTPTVALTAETVPLKSDVDLFYEMRKTYRIDDNYNHLVGWSYVDYTSAGGTFAGKTVLGPANPSAPTSTDLMHSFNVGERVWVQNSDTIIPIVGPISDYYTILAITEYSITIDLNFPGDGVTTPGKVFYKSWEQDQDGATPLILELNNTTSHNSDFNAFAFGNGVESNRIYDNFLRPIMKYSPRATSVIEDYQQQNKFASLCYSGIYKGDTSANRLNSFNLSQANFKNLDQKYGPVQKLYALDTNLMAFQQDKITSVLYGKNLLVDAVGGGQVASVPEVLGNQIVHPSEYGISNNPESFATFSNIMFFSDSRRGAVLQMTGDQVVEISANGMQNYFRDEMKDSPNTQKLGVFDPYNSTYVLSFTDEKQGSCDLSISPTSREIKKDSDNLFMFSISSNDFWVVSLVDDGFGTDWLSIGIDSGYGSQDITASVDQNLSVDRSVIFRVTYCDGETVDFILTQNGPV